MRFLDKTGADEFFASLEKNLNEQHSFEDNLHDRRVADVQVCLKNAASALRRAGLIKEAQCVAVISDKATGDYSPAQLVQFLADEGWTFPPAKDMGLAKDHNPDTCEAEDCAYCSEGKEPGLSQQELKQLREMLQNK